MKKTIKKYRANTILSVPIEQAETFIKDLGNTIQDYQDIGLTVEVQYQHTELRMSALILGFTNEEDK